jgi:hypothetical protein
LQKFEQEIIDLNTSFKKKPRAIHIINSSLENFAAQNMFNIYKIIKKRPDINLIIKLKIQSLI